MQEPVASTLELQSGTMSSYEADFPNHYVSCQGEHVFFDHILLFIVTVLLVLMLYNLYYSTVVLARGIKGRRRNFVLELPDGFLDDDEEVAPAA